MNKFIFKFQKCESGMIDFTIIAKKQKYTSSFWDTYDPFEEYIDWLERVLSGENNCTFYIDFDSNPGDDFAFNYKDDWFYIYRYGIDFNLPMIDRTNRFIFIGDYKMKVNISREKLVKELYYKFTNFVGSHKYNILQWESLRIDEYYEQTYGSLEKVLNKMESFSLKKLFSKLNKLNIHDEVFFRFPRNDDQKKLLKSGDYERFTIEEKIKYIKDNIFTEMITCCAGRYVLKELKSSIIENYFKQY
jgi:hypothetical protein